MAELEPNRGVTDVPLPADEAVGEDLSLLEDVLPHTPDGWVKQLGSLDFYKEHKKSIAVLGAAALAVGVGVYATRRGGGKVFVNFADRHAEKEGVISLGEAIEYGAAIAVPTRPEGTTAEGKTRAANAAAKLLFAMTGEPGEVVRPSGDPDQRSKYNAVAKRATGWLIEHFSSQTSENK